MPELREHLASAQNPDGGWGYYPGKQSWLEPTCWALMALEAGSECDRAWQLLQSWQRPDGAWRTGSAVDEPGWATALVVLLYGIRHRFEPAWERGLSWLLTQENKRETALQRLARSAGFGSVDQDQTLVGWPWRSGSSAWVEPTAYSILALRAAGNRFQPSAVGQRIAIGERLLLDRRCRDGGWNYGNRRVLGEDLDSFPETTAAALLALRGSPSAPKLADSLPRLWGQWRGSTTPMASALLTVVARVYGLPADPAPPKQTVPREVSTLALTIIGQPDGAWRSLANLGAA
jgi:hypothetical protein